MTSISEVGQRLTPPGVNVPHPHWFSHFGAIDYPEILSGPRDCDVQELKL